MSEIIKCHVLGVASETLNGIQSDSPGGAVWSGVRVRLTGGKTRFFPNVIVDAETTLIIQAATDRGEPFELWLSGKPKVACVYGVKHNGDSHYSDQQFRTLRKRAIQFLAIGILTLPILGLGVLGLIASIQAFFVASQFRPEYSREYFFSHGQDAALPQAA